MPDAPLIDDQKADFSSTYDRPDPREADGWFHADCFLSRPADAAAQVPIGTLLGSR
jgi:hypothetical protein